MSSIVWRRKNTSTLKRVAMLLTALVCLISMTTMLYVLHMKYDAFERIWWFVSETWFLWVLLVCVGVGLYACVDIAMYGEHEKAD